jgi:hypothetical protein
MPYLENDLLACCRSGFKGHQSIDVLNTILLCLWCIWKECNSRSFEGIESPPPPWLLQLEFFFLRLHFDWLKNIGDFNFSFLDFLNLYNFRL